MNIENEIFKRGKINIDKLIKYGFKKENIHYIYEKEIMNNTFKIVVTVDNKNNVISKIFDLFTNEEYINHKIKDNNGSFVNSIREEYEKLLSEIYNNCFDKEIFIYNQTNRINKLINEKYNISPVFLWESNPNFGVYKNSSNKWFGIIMNIDKSKIEKNKNGEVEIINIKLDDVQEKLKIKGIYPAYHMNKKYWVSIILDETLYDKYIMELIDESYKLVIRK